MEYPETLLTDGTHRGYRGKLPSPYKTYISIVREWDNVTLLDKYVETAKILDLDCSTVHGRVFRQIERELLKRLGEKSWEYMGND